MCSNSHIIVKLLGFNSEKGYLVNKLIVLIPAGGNLHGNLPNNTESIHVNIIRNTKLRRGW